MKNLFCCSLSTDSLDWTAIIALAVSIISLVYTAWYGRKTFRLTENHNKKTVEPLLTDLYYSEHVKKEGNDIFESYHIKNCGPGPAILKSIIIKYDNKEYVNINLLLVEQMVSNSVAYSTIQYFIYDEGNIIGSNDVLVLFKVIFPDKLNCVKFNQITRKISLELNYESIYKEKKQFIKPQISML